MTMGRLMARACETNLHMPEPFLTTLKLEEIPAIIEVRPVSTTGNQADKQRLSEPSLHAMQSQQKLTRRTCSRLKRSFSAVTCLEVLRRPLRRGRHSASRAERRAGAETEVLPAIQAPALRSAFSMIATLGKHCMCIG
eukprot:CAMPEP_0174700888 /NCGR_PEP_ID=MMETSP1094-20130205/5706_1 /TAXON_ID=156173 /ORGANISM="Chrysochromulina brevifilum, Strain UTEX LB 985" /LENGTH=137 /DNA_ID=CAMNT_0015898451 /DNA_START=319 /DNA_END=733 /DNA_ORIENTATION=+